MLWLGFRLINFCKKLNTRWGVDRIWSRGWKQRKRSTGWFATCISRTYIYMSQIFTIYSSWNMVSYIYYIYLVIYGWPTATTKRAKCMDLSINNRRRVTIGSPLLLRGLRVDTGGACSHQTRSLSTFDRINQLTVRAPMGLWREREREAGKREARDRLCAGQVRLLGTITNFAPSENASRIFDSLRFVECCKHVNC